MTRVNLPPAWKRGPVLAALALLLALVMLLHAQIPDWGWNLGSLVETFLPWLGLFIPVLLAGALWRVLARWRCWRLLPLEMLAGRGCMDARFGMCSPFGWCRTPCC